MGGGASAPRLLEPDETLLAPAARDTECTPVKATLSPAEVDAMQIQMFEGALLRIDLQSMCRDWASEKYLVLVGKPSIESALSVPLGTLFDNDFTSQLSTPAIKEIRAKPNGWEARVLKFKKAEKAVGGQQYFSAHFKKISTTHLLVAFYEITGIVKEQADTDHAKAFVFHEIGNLATGLRGIHELLTRSSKERRLPEKATLDKLGSNITMMGEVLYNFRSFTKLSTAVSTEAFDVTHLLNEVATLVRPRANVPIEVEVTGDPNVITSLFFMKIVLYNLCGNAAKFTTQGRIILRARRTTDTSMKIEVADTGRGIPDDKIATLFSFGEQSKRSDASIGDGIGLALVEKACRSVFHSVPEVESKLGTGTTVRFDINLASEASPTERPRTPPFRRDDSIVRRCLICDDVPLIRTTIRNLIIKALPPNWIISEAENGEQAIKMQQEKEFDLIFVDYHMQSSGGVLTGAETAAQLLAICNESIIVGVLGISSGDDKKSRLIGAGCWDVWGKPPPDPNRMAEALFGVSLEEGNGLFDEKDAVARKVALVCDDVEHVRQVHVRAVEELFPHWEVISAKHGEDAIAIGQTADLVLMDYHLSCSGGVMNGAEATRQLRELNASAVVIGITANASNGEIEREQLLDAGCADVIGKPLNRPELARLVLGSASQDIAPSLSSSSGVDDGILDLPRAVSNQGGNATDLQQMLPEFVAEVDAMMGQMSKTLTIAIVADDQLASLIQNELKCSAHALKGLALNFACSQLAHRALVLEQACVSRETVPRLQALLFEAQASARAVAQRVDGRRDLLGENGLLDVLEMDSNNNRSTGGGSDLGNCSPLSVSLTTSPIATYSTLAAHWEPTEGRGSKADAERPPTDVYSSPNTADVLLVEDSALARKFVTKLFKAKNLTFECSADGTEAVDRIRRGERFTVILMDKEMPGLGGVEATVSIRQLEEGVPMHIIGLTGNEDAATRAQFLQAGADGVVIKPLTAGVLDQVMLRRS